MTVLCLKMLFPWPQAQGLVSARELNVALRCAKGKEAEEARPGLFGRRLVSGLVWVKGWVEVG